MHSKLKTIKADNDFIRSKKYAAELQSRYDVDLVKLFELVSESEILVPASIFNRRLSSLETVSKYLYENIGLSFKSIAELMNRSEKTIWQAYNFSTRKLPKRLVVKDTPYLVPISVFADRKYSNLEAVVVFLREQYRLKFSEIGALLHRDQRTIWTVNSRARKKR